mmetsp:Transcript_19017/g.47499  ORF Transcript_19017/g.47499 Transcript_19017/m.47499 type:complete len:126 (-) Transcript_19017:5449-5826(-)
MTARLILTRAHDALPRHYWKLGSQPIGRLSEYTILNCSDIETANAQNMFGDRQPPQQPSTLAKPPEEEHDQASRNLSTSTSPYMCVLPASMLDEGNWRSELRQASHSDSPFLLVRASPLLRITDV